MRSLMLGVALAAATVGGAAAQAPDPSSLVGLWCGGAIHHRDAGSIELAIATVNDGVAFGTYTWRGSAPMQMSLNGTLTGSGLKVTLEDGTVLELALKHDKLDGLLVNRDAGRRWDVSLAKRMAC
ncbi:MAG: hypothetical protein IPK81_18645 [Rhodospirillales bacterium]|nr:MAG: hypothetical protein IPK81_18645 [Rhodospirillales bacterium]